MLSTAFVEVHETHAAVVFVVGDLVYKLKKPVDLGFLDFRTREDREAVCHREVELNRRMAPDVYLGVADVHGPDGAVCDHLVVMRRMPDERRLSTLISSGAPVDDDVRRLARLLAAFHATARRGPDISAQGNRNAILDRWDASFEAVRPFHGRTLDRHIAAEIERLTHAFLAGRQSLFDDRIGAGHIVDGHGDLLTGDIFCLDDGPRVLDCIEFDDRLRWVDTLDDAAFLAMDIEYLDAVDLAGRFFNWYAEFSADPAPTALRHHYLAYRAFVRTKVACLRDTQGDPEAAGEAARYADLAVRHLRSGAVRLILVGGSPGTGKSTLAGQLADRLGAVLISSDNLRKELAGLASRQEARAEYQHGIYSPAWTEHTYDELLKRAGVLLERGETVVLDASWTRAGHRAAARSLAVATHSDLVELRCVADPDVIATRVARRTGDASDADITIARALTVEADPWPQSTVVATDAEPDRAVEAALRRIYGPGGTAPGLPPGHSS